MASVAAAAANEEAKANSWPHQMNARHPDRYHFCRYAAATVVALNGSIGYEKKPAWLSPARNSGHKLNLGHNKR